MFDSISVLGYCASNLWAKKGEKYALLSIDCNFLTDFIFDKEIKCCDLDVNENKYIVKTDDGYGIINENGLWLSKFIYDKIIFDGYNIVCYKNGEAINITELKYEEENLFDDT